MADSVVSPIDPDHLSSEQVEQMDFVFHQISLHQLIQLASLVKQVCDVPGALGFGQVCIVIERGHPISIEVGHRSKFVRELDETMVRKLME